MSDESMRLVQWFSRIRQLYDAAGASPYGGDLNKWSARDVDAFIVLNEQRKKVENLSVVSDSIPNKRQR